MQLQTIRLRCERKKLKEAAQPSQLSPEDQAEAQAKSDAIAEVNTGLAGRLHYIAGYALMKLPPLLVLLR